MYVNHFKCTHVFAIYNSACENIWVQGNLEVYQNISSEYMIL